MITYEKNLFYRNLTEMEHDNYILHSSECFQVSNRLRSFVTNNRMDSSSNTTSSSSQMTQQSNNVTQMTDPSADRSAFPIADTVTIYIFKFGTLS